MFHLGTNIIGVGSKGATVSFTMNAFNEGGRYIRIFGTKGELCAYVNDSEIRVYTFEDCQVHKISISAADESITSGHGGDGGIVSELYDYLSGNYTGYCAADISISAKNHLIGFAAEKSRRLGTVEDVDAFFATYGFTNK